MYKPANTCEDRTSPSSHPHHFEEIRSRIRHRAEDDDFFAEAKYRTDVILASYIHGPYPAIPHATMSQPTNFEVRFHSQGPDCSPASLPIPSHISTHTRTLSSLLREPVLSHARLHQSRRLWSEEETGLWSGSGNPSVVSIRGCGEAITPPFDGVPSSRGACLRETVLSSVCYDGEAQTLSSPASRSCILLPLIQSIEDTVQLGACRGSVNR
ncbi:hypothetical protein ARMSODRAFT_805669 [Armillaria solidipes]|uniref:Uncharacterized protein n=1 Tax=Armillaria solidipes TaxID=1076256 RepID=A0A2H3B5W7_9AGAR|nr:hypothetical protein ARMSODRAFT_805669 [Armillaria solidipes]